MDCELLRSEAVRLGVLTRAPTIILDSVFAFMTAKQPIQREKAAQFCKLCKFFYDDQKEDQIMEDDMRDEMMSLLEELVINDATIDPRDVPDILIPFVDNLLINTDHFLKSLRTIVTSKIVAYGFPFSDYVLKNVGKWLDKFNDIPLNESEYMAENYPEVLELIGQGMEEW
jgi:hypothetical protein